jgi:hypothetical protein
MRNTAFRLVSSTASQSSSFMRMASWSRVMPALLTSTCSAPCSLTMASIRPSAAAASLTSSAAPRQPACAARAALILPAPSSVVAVPMTFMPRAASACAIAAPMPREAPVTRATWPAMTVSDIRFPSSSLFRPPAP